MRAFELYDTVYLKNAPSLCGNIERTHTDAYEPLDDDLIIAYTEVAEEVTEEFLLTGVPPAGYFYVQFEDEADGHALVSENDILLSSRTFQIGDAVKRDDGPMTGAVINLSQSYILEPVLSCPNYFASSLPNPLSVPKCADDCICLLPPPLVSHPNPHTLICDVPMREVKRAQDLVKDDYLVARNWIGQVDQVDYNIVICLDNESIVVVQGLEGLYLPVRSCDKPMIAVPKEDIWRPEAVVALQGWGRTVPLIEPKVGQLVVVERMILRTSRWVRGSYDPNTATHGTILEIRAGEVSVHWEQRTFPSRTRSRHLEPRPPGTIRWYQNHKTFKSSSSLRPRADMLIYDSGKMPSKQILEAKRFRRHDIPDPLDSIDSRDISLGEDIAVGDHVRFRDPTAAAVKYPGAPGTLHAKFCKFDPELFFGWDVNEFKVQYIKQEATVLWQNGTITVVNSTKLRRHAVFEAELAPTDVVFKRQGMRQRALQARVGGHLEAQEFNEMAFFEKPHDLIPQAVGIVQTVDPIERVAKIRWFQNPRVELRLNGQTMAPQSRYGPIGDDIEEMSLYEIMSFPALQRKRRDMCVVAPPKLAESESQIGGPGDGASRDVHPPIRTLWHRTFAPRPLRGEGVSIAEHRIDWFGEIVALGLDGSTTVRLGGLRPCRDVHMSSDDITALIESIDYTDDTIDDAMEVDSWGESIWSEDEEGIVPIYETIEYAGGHRLDSDSDDENWESEDHTDDEFSDAHETISQDDSNDDVDMGDSGNRTAGEDTKAMQPRGLDTLKERLGVEPPPQFAVLDQEPPADQFGLLTKSKGTYTFFVKRILQEHSKMRKSLPEGQIYVRTYESRLDLLRCLIVGPRDTPYEDAPFLVDLHLPDDFPLVPPRAHFHSWTGGLGRINPNLYEEGKICLSLLGTWSGKDFCEKWSDESTLLQVLVSLQGLVLVKKPFYNEAGFEGFENDSAYTRESELYSEKAFLMARGFVKHALNKPPQGLEDVLAWLYLSTNQPEPSISLGRVIERGKSLMAASEQARQKQDESLMDASGHTEHETKVFMKPLSRGASVMLKRTINELEELLEAAGHD